MEDFSKTSSTVASGFKQPRRIKTLGPCNENAQNFDQSLQWNYSADAKNQQDEIRARVKTLDLQVAKLQQMNQKLAERKEIEEAQQANASKYQQVMGFDKDAQKQVKNQINNKIATLDIEISEILKARAAFLRQTNQFVRGQVEQLTELKDKYIQDISKLSKTGMENCRKKAQQLRKQALQAKKDNSGLKQQIFGLLNTVRARLNAQVAEQQEKRNTQDQLIQNLLQKSCNKAEQALRRRLY